MAGHGGASWAAHSHSKSQWVAVAHSSLTRLEDVRDMPASNDKANFLYALATCHSLKKVDGEIIGDPLDVKMFDFTKWTLEEGQVAGTGVVKKKAGGDRPAALVQTVVRPPGSAQFRIEDALKGAGRVRCPLLCGSLGVHST